MEYGSRIPKGTYLAVRSPEDSFYLCKVLKDFNLETGEIVLINWLEEIGCTRQYVIGKKAKISTQSIICEVNLEKATRFKYQLTPNGELFIKNALEEILRELEVFKTEEALQNQDIRTGEQSSEGETQVEYDDKAIMPYKEKLHGNEQTLMEKFKREESKCDIFAEEESVIKPAKINEEYGVFQTNKIFQITEISSNQKSSKEKCKYKQLSLNEENMQTVIIPQQEETKETNKNEDVIKSKDCATIGTMSKSVKMPSKEDEENENQNKNNNFLDTENLQSQEVFQEEIIRTRTKFESLEMSTREDEQDENTSNCINNNFLGEENLQRQETLLQKEEGGNANVNEDEKIFTPEQTGFLGGEKSAGGIQIIQNIVLRPSTTQISSTFDSPGNLNSDISEEEPFIDSGSEYVPSENEKPRIIDLLKCKQKKRYRKRETKKPKEAQNFSEKEDLVDERTFTSSENDLWDLSDLSEDETKQRKKIVANENLKRKHIPISGYKKSTKSEKNKIIHELISKEEKLIKLRQKIKPKDTRKCTRSSVKISSAKKKEDNKRVYDKRHSCYFCHQRVVKMARHLETNHSNELQVARILSKPKKCSERRNDFLHLIRVGDFYHNVEVITQNKGELILSRRPSSSHSYSVSEFGPCPYCLGFMLKRLLWLHVKTCTAHIRKSDEKTRRHMIQMESNALLNSFISDIDPQFRQDIVDTMKNDKITELIRTDTLILQFGKMQFQKYGLSQKDMIRQNMRQLGRLKMELKQQNMILDFQELKDFLKPEYFDRIVDSVKTLSKLDCSAKKPEYGIPSLAMKLGYNLRKCIGVLRGQALRKGDTDYDIALRNFLDILDLEWNIRISHNAIASLHRRKINTTSLLPITSDLIKLNKYISTEINSLQSSLLLSRNDKNLWMRLAQVVLSRVILFNKRRGGEASRMLLNQYLAKPDWSNETTEEMKKSLSELEKKMAKDMKLIQIHGKRGRTVSVLLDKTMCGAIDTLIETRNSVGVSLENPYVFARVFDESKEALRGPDCLRTVASGAQLEAPETVTSTKLRKYVATVSQIFDLKEYELDWLANHLGHDIRVHRDFYRMGESAVELTKISRLLMVIDEGKASNFYGKRLEEINLNDLPDLEVKAVNNIPGPSAGESTRLLDEVEPVSTDKRNEKQIIKTDNSNSEEEHSSTSDSEPQPKRKRKAKPKRPWSSEESAAVTSFFRTEIKKEIVPGKKKCEELISLNPVLFKTRTWTDIKYYVKNFIVKCKRVAKKI